MSLFFVATPCARAGILYSDGFEPTDLAGADFYDSTTGNQGQNISIVANGGGALHLTAAHGSYYAEITNTDDAYSTANSLPSGYGQSVFTDYGYYRNGGTFDPISGQPLAPGVATSGAFYESTAFYIDAQNWAPNSVAAQTAFWIDTTPYSDPASLDENNFRVTVPVTGTVQVAAFVGNPGSNGPVATITSSGWYTFKTTFENSGGFVSNTLSVIDSSGNVLGSYTGVSTLPFASLTGTNYGDWVTVWDNGFAGDVLGIDDVEVGTIPVPEPSSVIIGSLLALVTAGGFRWRRDRKAAA